MRLISAEEGGLRDIGGFLLTPMECENLVCDDVVRGMYTEFDVIRNPGRRLALSQQISLTAHYRDPEELGLDRRYSRELVGRMDKRLTNRNHGSASMLIKLLADIDTSNFDSYFTFDPQDGNTQRAKAAMKGLKKILFTPGIIHYTRAKTASRQ